MEKRFPQILHLKGRSHIDNLAKSEVSGTTVALDTASLLGSGCDDGIGFEDSEGVVVDEDETSDVESDDEGFDVEACSALVISGSPAD